MNISECSLWGDYFEIHASVHAKKISLSIGWIIHLCFNGFLSHIIEKFKCWKASKVPVYLILPYLLHVQVNIITYSSVGPLVVKYVLCNNQSLRNCIKPVAHINAYNCTFKLEHSYSNSKIGLNNTLYAIVFRCHRAAGTTVLSNQWKC